jgi:molybdate transport system substrate-binding protein
MRRCPHVITPLLVALVLAAAAIGAGARSRITVYAAASLTDVFPKIDPGERYSFAGSNMLAAQIEQGAPADVFASANTKLPARLHRKGLCSRPVVFTRNALVIVVPKSNPAHVRTVADVAKPGVKVVVAAAGVPAGDYTSQVLARLHLTARVEANVVSRETDVREVLAKVALGEADAGFVYATDTRTVRRRVNVIGLPARAQPTVRYGICVVTTSKHESEARAFVASVLGKRAQAKLLAAGFLPLVAP